MNLVSKIHDSDFTVTDQFCGAGGSSTGAAEAGARVKLALNHWALAVQTHNQNHPNAAHDCTDIQACNPKRYPSTTILITSPECTNHSLAKGKKRKDQAQIDLFGENIPTEEADRSRATMWDVPRFAEFHDYQAVIVENVVDARYWRMWDAWLMAMHALGYEHKAVYINSQFMPPTPQSRDRMFVVFWKKGNKAPDLEFRPEAYCQKCGETCESFQSWKNPTKKWGKYKQQYVYRCSSCGNEVTPFHYAAWNAIDWSIAGQKIGDRQKPLSDKTIKRIETGLKKYGANPIIVTPRYSTGMECRVRNVSETLPTQPGDASHALCIPPFLIGSEYDPTGAKTRSLQEPTWTQTTRQTAGILIPPIIVENYGTGSCKTSAQALGTVTAGGVKHGLLMANYSPGWVRDTLRPLGTVTTTDHHGIITGDSLNAFLQYYYSTGSQTSHIKQPIATVTTTDRASLITPHGIDVNDCEYRMLRPHEIQIAMAFPREYIVLGNSRQKVKQLGNAVTPPVMKWLVERVIQSLS